MCFFPKGGGKNLLFLLLHCTVEDLNVKCAHRNAKSVQSYCAVCMTSHTRVQCTGTAAGVGVQCGDIMSCVSLCKAKNIGTAALLGAKWHNTDWGETCQYDQSFRSPRWARFHSVFNLSHVPCMCFSVRTCTLDPRSQAQTFHHSSEVDTQHS